MPTTLQGECLSWVFFKGRLSRNDRATDIEHSAHLSHALIGIRTRLGLCWYHYTLKTAHAPCHSELIIKFVAGCIDEDAGLFPGSVKIELVSSRIPEHLPQMFPWSYIASFGKKVGRS